jgi:hypothetical protein
MTYLKIFATSLAIIAIAWFSVALMLAPAPMAMSRCQLKVRTAGAA